MTAKQLGETKSSEKEITAEKANASIPKTITCAIGADVPYEKFKERYSSIYTQVGDMRHLIVGRLTYSDNIGGKLPFTVHTLKQAEEGFLSSFMPVDSTSPDFTKDWQMYRIVKTVLSLAEFNNNPLPPMVLTFETTKEDWKKRAAAQLSLVTDLDSELMTYISNVCDDIMLAKRLAFLELLPNP